MGLDTTHNAFHGAYSSFHRFRSQLLDLTDQINAESLVGYGGTAEYEVIKNKGIRRLMDQSDCEGEISPKDCKLIADSLDAYIPLMDKDSELYSRSVQFRDGCLLAFSKGETLEFG